MWTSNRQDPPVVSRPFAFGEVECYAEIDYDLLKLRLRSDGTVARTVQCPVSGHGCDIEEIDPSPSGEWLVTLRNSGQGEWGYDVIRTSPLARVGGVVMEQGYMMEIPCFSPDEARIVGGFGGAWLGGWWAHSDDDYESPARGGLISFGFLLVHHLPSQKVERHEMKIELPMGWLPEDIEDEIWFGATKITPGVDNIRMSLYGGVEFEVSGPLPPVIILPTPHPSGRKLL